MNISLLSEEQALSRIKLPDVKKMVKEAFAGLASGTSVQPAQTVTVFPGTEGDCIFYPGVLWDQKVIGVKLSPYIAELSRKGNYPVTAYTMLMSAETGQPILVCDSLALTTIRTAATTSLALDYLIPEQAKNLAIIGSGKIAIHHLKYAVDQHTWSNISMFSPTLADQTSDKRQKVSQAIKNLNADVTFAPSAQDAIGDADVVMLCTSSGTPVIEYEWLKDRVVVTSISTNVPKAHEISPVSLQHFDVFCDYRKTAPLSAGEMVIAKAEYGWSEESVVADLPELVTGKHSGISATSGKVFFRSIGLGIEDLAIATLLV